ncbi:MAG TPA: SAM-dependent methyltransferase [Gammaproteobacteria bacterium]|nr:SAM-dependent methyltransferase [Gammaproteobacteria bacterium]
MSGFYASRIFPHILDFALRKLEAERKTVVSRLRGRVLEIGVGTGANLPHYHRQTEVVGIEPLDAMLGKAAQRLEQLRATGGAPQVTLERASAEDLPFADHSFDQVLVFLVLCTIPNANRAVAEAARVLKPGGEIHFFEHVEAPDPPVARWQRRLNPFWKKFACGCHLNRSTETLFEQHGLQLVDPERSYVANMGPKIAGYVTRGRAVKPATT